MPWRSAITTLTPAAPSRGRRGSTCRITSGRGSAYANQPGVGFYEVDKTDNSYHPFSAGGQDWLILVLEYAPRDPVVAWGNQIANAFPDHNLILLTHSYLYEDNTRYDYATYGSSQAYSPYRENKAFVNMPGGVNDGEELWQGLVSRHPNFRLTFNGHVLGDGEGFLTSTGVYGNEVHQMLANYQNMGQGGYGYLRLVEFKTDGTVHVSTYSPTLDVYHPGEAHHMTMSVEGPRLAGDFNNDHVVDAADFIAWRKVNGTAAQYALWASRFGDVRGPSESASVPEPPAILLLAAALAGLAHCRSSIHDADR